MDLLQNLRLKVTPPLYFNDPFEFTPNPVSELPLERARRLAENSNLLTDIYTDSCRDGSFHGSFEQFLTYYRDLGDSPARYLIESHPSAADETRRETLTRISRIIAVACYSSVHDDILMWSHYASNHAGFVVAFDTSHLSSPTMPILHEVEYREERVRFDLGLETNDPEYDKQVLALIRRKSSHWAYEREWRQLFIQTECHYEPESQRHFAQITPSCLHSVHLGLRASSTLTAEVEALLQTSRLSHVQLSKAELHESEYSLRFKPNGSIA